MCNTLACPKVVLIMNTVYLYDLKRGYLDRFGDSVFFFTKKHLQSEYLGDREGSI